MRANRRFRFDPVAGLLCLAMAGHACAEATERTCTSMPCTAARADGGSVPDSSAADARIVDAAMHVDAMLANGADLPPLSSCVQQPQDAPFAPLMVVSTLASLCEALSAAGIAHCPEDRAAYLQSLDQECRPGRAFPAFDRRCGVDHVAIWSDVAAVTWYFDAATGALIGARVLRRSGTSLPCAPATVYRGGAALTACSTSDGSCSLCVAEPDECPADISTAIPTAPCGTAAAEAATCACGDANPRTGVSFPEHASVCGGADQCASCESGTCWADCRCLRTGERRYVVQCTE